MGPHSSCSRMIDTIIEDQPHFAISACLKGEDNYLTILKFLGSLIAERVTINLDKLYGEHTYPRKIFTKDVQKTGRQITMHTGGRPSRPPLPQILSQQFEDQIPRRETFREVQTVSYDFKTAMPSEDSGITSEHPYAEI